MNRLVFSTSVAILSIVILSHDAHGTISHLSIPDTSDRYKHDARITSQTGLCSGSIISDWHILTAAHCFTEEWSKEVVDISQYLIEVTVGIKHVDNPNSQIVRVVETIFLHENFTNIPLGAQRMFADIAVLKLNRELGLQTNPNIEALALPRLPSNVRVKDEEAYYSTRKLTSTGFGILGREWKLTREGYKDVPIHAHYLYYSSAKIIPNTDCGYDYPLYKLCVRLKNTDNSFVCGGDSGGALLDEETKEIIGVTSTGSRDCDSLVTSAYTRVIAFVDLISWAVKNGTEYPGLWRRISFENVPSYRTRVQLDQRYHSFPTADPLDQPRRYYVY